MVGAVGGSLLGLLRGAEPPKEPVVHPSPAAPGVLAGALVPGVSSEHACRLRDKASVAWPLCGCSRGRASPLSAAGLQSGSSGLSQLGPSDPRRVSSQPLPASRVAFPGLASGLLEGA